MRAANGVSGGPVNNSSSQTRTRVGTALVLFTLLAAVLLLGPAWLWSLVVLLLAGVAAWEWSGLCLWPRRMRIAFVALVVLLALLMALRAGHDAWLDAAVLLGALLFWVLVVPLALRSAWSGRGARGMSGVLLIVPLVWALLWLQQQTDGNLLLVAGMAVVWVSDSAAYFAGRRWGRHKLAPAISPGKTLEGVAGAVAGVVLYTVLLVVLDGPRLPAGLAELLPLTLFMCLLGIVGDLYESWVKRVAGVKDSGACLPGHGGLLDRVDALAAALPAWAGGLWLAGFGA
ncbi:MAG: phosphatidate cytidylyltransferase [Rhodocyclaceae bacterium]|nr:phosphatidate cytidylyltransferase [Rhodocyclaceae bacterium]